MRKPIRNTLAAAALVLLAGACSVLPKREPIQVFAPTHGPVTVAAEWPTVSWSLLVAEPSGSQQFKSERIAVRPGPGTMQVYQSSSWTDPPTELVQTALVRGFEDSKKILAVSRPGSGARGDYSLQSELRSFTSVYEGGQPQAVVELHVRLVRSVDGRVVAAQLMREAEPAADTEIASVVQAFSRALDRSRDRVIGWTLAQGQAHAATIEPASR